MEIVFTVVGKLSEYAIDPLLCQFKHIFCYNSKIQTFRDEVKDLQNKESNVRQLVVEAERNVEAIKPDVKDWLQNVDEIKKKADEVFKGATNSEIKCLFLRCPNLKTRYLLGRKATEKTAEVAKLQKKGTLFHKVGDPKPLAQTPYQNPNDFGAFETRISIKKDIMEALKDKNVRIIGICGMGGVGKTTMAKEVAKEAEVNKLFDEFAWADVSQVPAVTKIQDQLAEKLGLKIKDVTDKYVRVQRLHQRLEGDGRKSILVTLDDVWDDTVLETIGIPSAGDDIGLKIILTSRNKDVCERLRARIFDVHHLNEKESWELFKEKAEISDDATDVIKGIAEEVTRECGGLPLALVTVGRALSKKPEHAWKNALEELRNSRVANIKGVQKVYLRIELSYNYLESDEAKSLLRLCSLFREGGSIATDDLVRYAWGLQLFKGTTTLIATRYKINSIVDNLKSCYLLLSTWKEERVKLHDVVRDVCLQIASKEKHAYMSKHIGLKEWPKHDNNEIYGAICLTSNELNQLPSGLEYPNLKFLQVTCNHQSLNMPKEFFAHMNSLEVIDFTAMGIQIPSSIQSVTNLRTLCLDFCTLNIKISTIGTLKKLEVLSFRGSDLDHFPNDIAELSNLRLLDLRLKHSSSRCPLPPGILTHLKRLEELYMGVIELREDELEQRGYIINEISSLTGLNTFQIITNHPQFLLQMLKDMCIEELERFHIELTDLEYARENVTEYYYFRRRLHIRGITYASVLSQPAVNSLMWRADNLSIEMDLDNPDGLSLQVMERKNMFDEDGFENLNGNHPTGAFDGLKEIYLDGIPKMKHLFWGVIKPPSLHNLVTLTIANCPSLKSLFSESAALCMVNLQKLNIFKCEMLEEIVSMDREQNEVTQMLESPTLIKPTSLHNLTTLTIVNCPSLKSLFSESVALCMVNLQELSILCCKMLEEIVSMDTEQNEITQMLEFSKLKYIRLQHLDNLKSFRCGSNKTVGVLSPLFNQVTCPNLEILSIMELGCTVNILDELRQIGSHKLRNLRLDIDVRGPQIC